MDKKCLVTHNFFEIRSFEGRKTIPLHGKGEEMYRDARYEMGRGKGVIGE